MITSTDNDKTCSSFKCLNEGDIIVFEPNSPTQNSEPGKTIVHRIEEIGFDSDGQRVIRTKGDANPNLSRASIILLQRIITSVKFFMSFLTLAYC